MPACDYCGTTIIFGGVKDSNLRFCSDKCHENGYALVLAKEIPDNIVDQQTDEIHQGACPQCQGTGPIDAHVAYRVYSILIYSSWKSELHVCCRSCGIRNQIVNALFSFFLAGGDCLGGSS